MHPQFYFKEKFCVRAYEVDHQKRITAPALTRVMHETAMQQVVHLGLSVWDLEPYQVSWVLVRMHIEFVRMPVLGEVFTVQTNPAGFEKIFTHRDYRVFDAHGELIAWASSTWLLIDTVSRKMTTIPDFIRSFEIPSDLESLPRPHRRLPPVQIATHALEFQVHWFDLDFNHHLNNLYYLQWMLEVSPLDFLKKKTLKTFDLIYKYEGYHEDKVRSEYQQLDENTLAHRLIRLRDGVEMAQGKSVWTSEPQSHTPNLK